MKTMAINEGARKAPIRNNGSTPTFKGGYTLSKEVSQKITEQSPKMIRNLINLGKNDGEILNILVTAIGTAFVAPFFIAFNPLSKEDKETKIYSALRQPISAVIAVAAQLGIVSKFNSGLDKLASTDQIDRAKLSAKPKEGYLKKIIKLQHPEFSKEEIQEEVKRKMDSRYQKKFSELQKNMTSAEIEDADLICGKFYKQAKAELTKEAKESGMKVGKKTIQDTDITKRAMEIIEKEMAAETEFRYELSTIKHGTKTFDETIENLVSRLDTAVKNEDKEAKNLLEKVIAELKNKGSLEKIRDFGKNKEAVAESVKIERFLKTSINNAEAVLGATKKYGGIVLSLLTLPVTCGILNWAYPRIMEKLMPDVANKKKAKEGK